MPKKVTREQRESILRLLREGQDRDTIAAVVGVTPGQVSAVSAHVKMGTYALPEIPVGDAVGEGLGSASPLTECVRDLEAVRSAPGVSPILLGKDAETEEPVCWNPDPANGTANPHVLILGESGTGKTYCISCLVAELGRAGVVSIIFDYGQGFSLQGLSAEFVARVRPVEIDASRDGVNINPLQIFPTDIHGPVNVAQRVADTFGRVYSKIGIQQHAAIRQAVLDVLVDAGIRADKRESWTREPPRLGELQVKLNDYAADPLHPQSRPAGTAASHVSTLFVFDTFRHTGHALAWGELLASRNPVIVIQLRGLEHSLERAVTEFLRAWRHARETGRGK